MPSLLCLVAAAYTTEFFAVRGDGTVSVGTDINTADTAADAVTLAPSGDIASTGTVTIANAGATNALIIKDGSTTTAQIFKGGAATFTGAVTGASFKNADSSFTVASNGNLLARQGTFQHGLSTSGGDGVILANNVIVGNVTQEYYFHQYGAFQVRDSDNDVNVELASNGNVTIAGDTTIGVVGKGVQSNFYGSMQLKAASTGTTAGDFIIKNISDVATVTLSNDGAISTKNSLRFNDTTANQNIRAFGNAAKTLTLGVSNSTATSPADNLFNQNLILSETGTVTNGNLTVNGGANDTVIFKRGSSASSFVWDIQGTTEADKTDGTQRLFSVFRNTPGSASDAIGYYGRVEGDANIQTKASVEALIASTPAGANLLKGGTIKKTGGTTSTSGNLAIQSTDTDSGNLFIRDSSANTLTQLSRTGDISMGDKLVLGNVSTLNTSTKIIDAVSTSSPNIGFRTSTNGTAFTERFNIGVAEVRSNQAFVSTKTITSHEQVILTGNQSGNNTGDFLDSKAQIKFDSTGRYASIWKTGSTSSNNNAFRIYCGTNSTTSNVGIRYPLMTLANQNGTFTAQIGPVDVSNVRQEFDNEIVLMKTLKSGVINATNVVSTTADSTDAFGDAQKTTTQLAATIPAALHLEGNNTHGGTNEFTGTVIVPNATGGTHAVNKILRTQAHTLVGLLRTFSCH